MTVTELENRIAVLLGGRTAEQLIYGEVSTGARDDLKKATDIAKSMVKAYGMSSKFGPVSFDTETPSPFMQSGQPQLQSDYSTDTAQEIDQEVRDILEAQQARITNLLTARLDVLKQAATLLLEREVLHGEELRELVANA